ncbi:MAG: hypothetical protein RIE77_11760 [Phycisphaerales bacterium]|jgi:hypothetical protein
MAAKKSGLMKNVILLVIIFACAGGVWYFLTQQGGAMNETEAQEWFLSGEMAQEGLDLEGVKARLGHDAPQDMGEGRHRFDMAYVNSSNTLVVDVVVRGGRAISYTIVEEAE